MVITPAPLELTTKDLVSVLTKVTTQLPDVMNIHIDVMDGKLVANKNDIDPDLIANVESPLRFELHLMVEDPVEYMRAWRNVENVFRVLYHAEAKGDLLRPASFARREGWDVGLVLNPETTLESVEKILPHVDLALFMTVQPGKQGQPLVPEVLEKIKTFTAHRPTCEYSRQPLLCAVDGHVNIGNVAEFKKIGVDVCNVGSALVKADDMIIAWHELNVKIRD